MTSSAPAPIPRLTLALAALMLIGDDELEGRRAMTTAGGPKPGEKPFDQKLQEGGARLEEELRRIVRYIDDEVVPEVRRNGSTALHYAAEQLQRLARHLDDSRNAPPPPPPQGTGR